MISGVSFSIHDIYHTCFASNILTQVLQMSSYYMFIVSADQEDLVMCFFFLII